VGFKPYLNDQLVSFSALTLLVWSLVKIVPNMTYNVLSGTLNLAESINLTYSALHICQCIRPFTTNKVLSGPSLHHHGPSFPGALPILVGRFGVVSS